MKMYYKTTQNAIKNGKFIIVELYYQSNNIYDINTSKFLDNYRSAHQKYSIRIIDVCMVGSIDDEHSYIYTKDKRISVSHPMTEILDLINQ